MFSQACVKNSVQGGVCLSACKDTHPREDTPPGKHPQANTPLGRHSLRDGHCSRWYASYWNAFLLNVKIWNRNRTRLKIPIIIRMMMALATTRQMIVLVTTRQMIVLVTTRQMIVLVTTRQMIVLVTTRQMIVLVTTILMKIRSLNLCIAPSRGMEEFL